MKIHEIKISGFKSLADFTIKNLGNFSAFAGANGAGKSNVVDAIGFVAAIYELGAEKALRMFRGYDQVHSWKKHGVNAKTFKFSLRASVLVTENMNKLSQKLGVDPDSAVSRDVKYSLVVHDMDSNPWLEERLYVDGELRMIREGGEAAKIRLNSKDELHPYPMFGADKSILMFDIIGYVSPIFRNFRVFRFDPFGAKEPDASSADDAELNVNGHNVATMLSVLEKKKNVKEEILNWLGLIVPGVVSIETNRQKLDGSTLIKFKEVGTKNKFPAGMISDGTIYALCIMVALYSRVGNPGITVIEEPERGIHPQAISQLVELMRELATDDHTIIITTHSEAVVRSLQPEELWLASKLSGHTKVVNAGESGVDLHGTQLDEAWMMNIFGAGLPW